jgi:hypothetical protein
LLSQARLSATVLKELGTSRWLELQVEAIVLAVQYMLDQASLLVL